MVYCGEAAIEGKPLPAGTATAAYCSGGPIAPAQGFAMVFSNACYAPGAGETEGTTPSSEGTALTRVNYYSRPYLALGGTYFASDVGSRSVVEEILDNPNRSFGEIFTLANGYSATALRTFPHWYHAGSEAWIQRTQGPGGLWSYWYAFAGDPYRMPRPGPPNVAFAATPTSGLLQLPVAFINQSATYGATTWAWDFDGNGTTDSTERSPVWTYPTAGTYTVSLTATNSLGTDTSTRTSYISVTTPQPGTYSPLAPARLLDTRNANGLSGQFASRVPRTFQVTGRGGVPAGAVGVTGNLSVTNQSSAGYVYLGPSEVSLPQSSTLNVPAGDTRANGVTVALSPSGTLSPTWTAFGGGGADLLFDVTGYFMPNTSGATYVPLTPARVLDSRSGTGLSGPFVAGVPRTFQVTGMGGVPANAVAVTGNLAMTNQTAGGFTYLGPDPLASPPTSTLNAPWGDTRANGVTVRLGPGGTLSATFSYSGSAHLLFDVTGYFVAGGGGATFVPLSPNRLLDSRTGNGLSGAFLAGVARTFQVSGRGGVPASAVAVTGNLTMTAQTAGGFAYLGPDADGNPSSSTLNAPWGDTRANGATVALGPGGTLSATFAYTGSSQLIFDVTGYFVDL
jgi:PKD repeat protein